MNPRTSSSHHSTLHPAPISPAGIQEQTPARVLGQAIEMEKNALASALCMNSCVMGICQHALPFGIGGFFEAENQALANCLDLELQWLGLAPLHTEMIHLPPTEEEMDLSMDIAVAAFENEILA